MLGNQMKSLNKTKIKISNKPHRKKFNEWFCETGLNKRGLNITAKLISDML